MPLTGQPTFEARDIPTVTQMTAWMTTISNKFGSGSGENTSLQTADFEWPMQAGGHLDMDGNDFDKIPRLGSIYSLADRRPWQTARMIFEEVEARGGGTVLLPGNTTIVASTDKDGFTGVRVGSTTTYAGHGHSSVSGQLYMDTKDDIRIQDMQIGGNSTLKNCNGVHFRNVNFTATSGTQQILLENCTNIWFTNCKFVGAATSHIRFKNCENVWVKKCWFEDWDDHAIRVLNPDFRGGVEIHIIDNIFYHPAASASTSLTCIWIQTTNISALTVGTTTIEMQNDNNNCTVRGNIFQAKSGQVQLDRGRHIKISSNYFGDLTIGTRQIYITAPLVAYLDVNNSWKEGLLCSSNVIATGVDIGIQVQQATNAVVRGNVIHAADECLIFEQINDSAPTSLFDDWRGGSCNVILGNMLYTDDAAIPAATVWNLKGSPTKLFVKMIFTGNHMDGASSRGYRSFTDLGVTAGGEIGDTTGGLHKPWWTFVANNSQGTTTTGAANTDMVDSSSNRSTVLDNNT